MEVLLPEPPLAANSSAPCVSYRSGMHQVQVVVCQCPAEEGAQRRGGLPRRKRGRVADAVVTRRLGVVVEAHGRLEGLEPGLDTSLRLTVSLPVIVIVKVGGSRRASRSRQEAQSWED